MCDRPYDLCAGTIYEGGNSYSRWWCGRVALYCAGTILLLVALSHCTNVEFYPVLTLCEGDLGNL